MNETIPPLFKLCPRRLAKQIRDELDLESGAARPEELSREVSEKKTAWTELELEMIRNSQVLCLPCPCPTTPLPYPTTLRCCPHHTPALPCPTFKISSTSIANYCSLACVSTYSMGPIFRLCCSNAKKVLGAVYLPMLDSPACMEPYGVPGPGEGWGGEELEVQSQVNRCLLLP